MEPSLSYSLPLGIPPLLVGSTGLGDSLDERKTAGSPADSFGGPVSPIGLESTSLSSSSSRAMSSWSDDHPGDDHAPSPLVSDTTHLSLRSHLSPPSTGQAQLPDGSRGTGESAPLVESRAGDRFSKRKSTSPTAYDRAASSSRKRPTPTSRTQSATTLTPLMTIQSFSDRPTFSRALTSVPIHPIDLHATPAVNNVFAPSSLPSYRHPGLLLTSSAAQPAPFSSSALGSQADHGYEALASVVGLDLSARMGSETDQTRAQLGQHGLAALPPMPGVDRPGPSSWRIDLPLPSSFPASTLFDGHRPQPAFSHGLSSFQQHEQRIHLPGAFPSSYPGGSYTGDHPISQPPPALPGMAHMDPSRLLASPPRQHARSGPFYLPPPSALFADAGHHGGVYGSAPAHVPLPNGPPVTAARSGSLDNSYAAAASSSTTASRMRARPAAFPKVMKYNYPEKQFKCLDCPQSFSRNHDLKRHQKIHLAVRPFSCTNCGKDFTRKDALRRHLTVKGDCGRVVELPKSAAKLRREEAARCKELGLPPPPRSAPHARTDPASTTVGGESGTRRRDEPDGFGSGSGSSDVESDEEYSLDSGRTPAMGVAFLGGALSPFDGPGLDLPPVGATGYFPPTTTSDGQLYPLPPPLGYHYPTHPPPDHRPPPPTPPHAHLPAPFSDPALYPPLLHQPFAEQYQHAMPATYAPPPIPQTILSPDAHVLPPIHSTYLDSPLAIDPTSHAHAHAPWDGSSIEPAPAPAPYHPTAAQRIHHPQPQRYAPYPEAGLDVGARVWGEWHGEGEAEAGEHPASGDSSSGWGSSEFEYGGEGEGGEKEAEAMGVGAGVGVEVGAEDRVY